MVDFSRIKHAIQPSLFVGNFVLFTSAKNENGENPPAEAGNLFTISSNQVKILVWY